MGSSGEADGYDGRLVFVIWRLLGDANGDGGGGTVHSAVGDELSPIGPERCELKQVAGMRQTDG